jgi:hypothetical protein
MNGCFCPKPEVKLEMWLGNCEVGVGRLIKWDIPKYQNYVICTLMGGVEIKLDIP